MPLLCYTPSLQTGPPGLAPYVLSSPLASEREYKGAAMRDITPRARQRFPSGAAAPRRATASRIPYAVAALLVLVTLAVFWQVHSYEFVLWDDGLHIYENPYLQALTFDNILAFWREPYAELYIPLTWTLWALTAAVSGAITANPTGGTLFDPQLFHLLNLLLHPLTVLVVWRLACLLLGGTAHACVSTHERSATSPSPRRVEWAAGGGALLFAIHPLQVEAVAWATGFKDVLCGFLSCVALWQYLRYAQESGRALRPCADAVAPRAVSGGSGTGRYSLRSPCADTVAPEATSSGQPPPDQARRSVWRYWLATVVFVLALLAKPMAVVVPVVAWVLDTWRWPQTWRHRRPALLVWLGLAVVWGLFTSLKVQPPAAGAFIPPLWSRLLIAGDTVTFYLAKLAVPFWLGPDYGRSPQVMLAQSGLWLTGLLPWGLAGWLWYKRTRVPWLAATAGVFVAGLLPVLGLVPFAFQAYSTVADRYMYIAMLGPALALAWGLAQVHQGELVQWRWLAVGCVVVLGLLGIRSAWQAHYWHDTESLFAHELVVHPWSSVAHNTLGMVRAAQHRLTEAARYYTEAIRLWPGNTQAHNNLGNVLRRQGQMPEAIEQFTTALRLKPSFAEAHNNLGATLADQGHFAEAISHYTTALQLQPRYVNAHYNLGNALIGQGQIPEAIAEYTAALRLKPNFAQAHYNLGVILADQGHLAEARQHLAEVLRLDPNHAKARRFLSNMGNP